MFILSTRFISYELRSPAISQAESSKIPPKQKKKKKKIYIYHTRHLCDDLACFYIVLVVREEWQFHTGQEFHIE